jgi:transcriptional regulator with XRE-family HTH domain
VYRIVDLSFGEILREERFKARYSVTALARVLGCSVAYVSDVELGRKDPFSINKIIETAKLFKIKPDRLLSAAAQHKGTVNFDIEGYPQAGIDLLNGLARGKRSPEVYTKLLKDLESADRKKAADDKKEP